MYVGLCTFISLIFALILMLSDTLSNLCPEFNPEAPKDGIPGQSDRLQVDQLIQFKIQICLLLQSVQFLDCMLTCTFQISLADWISLCREMYLICLVLLIFRGFQCFSWKLTKCYADGCFVFDFCNNFGAHSHALLWISFVHKFGWKAQYLMSLYFIVHRV